MSKIYQIIAANGTAKTSWEEIICEYVVVSGETISFHAKNNNLLILYKLADGEALIYIGQQ